MNLIEGLHKVLIFAGFNVHGFVVHQKADEGKSMMSCIGKWQ